jgi:hypothetical protein
VTIKARHAVEDAIVDRKAEVKGEPKGHPKGKKWAGGLYRGISLASRHVQGNQKERDGGDILREGWL